MNLRKYEHSEDSDHARKRAYVNMSTAKIHINVRKRAYVNMRTAKIHINGRKLLT